MNPHIEIRFKKSKSSKGIVPQTAKRLYITESELGDSIAKLTFDKSEADSIGRYNFCEIRIDDNPYFEGKFSSTYSGNDEFEVELKKELLNEDTEFVPSFDDNVVNLEKFKLDNPDLFQSTTQKKLFMPGKTMRIVDLEDDIVQDSLKVEKSEEMPINELELEIKGSWIRKKSGSVSLSSRISGLFSGGKIHTLTPKKLENSWPKFGDRIFGKSARSTKYTVGISKLDLSEKLDLADIEIGDSIPPLHLSKYSYDNKLHIFWDFDQYTTESVSVRVIDEKNEYSRKKQFVINLKNVQEYVSDPYSETFFQSEMGKLILDEIVESAKNYIVLSNRNIEISFDIVSSKHIDISCKDWIKLRGVLYKVSGIERIIDHEKCLTKIKVRGFNHTHSYDERSMRTGIQFGEREMEDISFEDVIENVTVENDSDTQLSKLKSFIKQEKGRFSKKNYKSIINKFFRDNQTKIKIIAKPLKTEHCEKKVLEPLTLCLGE